MKKFENTFTNEMTIEERIETIHPLFFEIKRNWRELKIGKFPRNIKLPILLKDYYKYGSCRRKNKNEITICRIVLNKLLLENDCQYDLIVTLIHEILHAYLPNEEHGEKWQKLAKKVTKKWGYTISKTNKENTPAKKLLRKKRKKSNEYN